MKISNIPAPVKNTKSATGILGFDEMVVGGLPTGRTTLLGGGPGSGKSIFAMHFLTHGVRYCNEPGIFVAFEESPERIVANFESFGWELSKLSADKLFFIDAQPQADIILAGSFDISGLLATLAAKAKQIGARRIVFDALDVLLSLLPDEATRTKEIYRLHTWLLTNNFTGLITVKTGLSDDLKLSNIMQFMMDCVVMLNHHVVQGISQRNIRVLKFRGTSFDEDESPFVISNSGFDVAIARTLGRVDANVSDERVTRRSSASG